MRDSQFILRSDVVIEPFQPDNLYKFVSVEWDQHLDDVAFVNTADVRQLTYKELNDAIDVTSRRMATAGVQRGSVVSIWCTNCSEIMIVAMATWKLEGLLAVIGPSLIAEEARRQIVKVKSSFVFADDTFSSTIKESMFERDSVVNVFNLGSREFLKLNQANNKELVSKFNPDRDTAIILFSSGTTGFPKAVQLTHTNMTCALYLTGKKVTDRVMPPAIHFLPMSHFYGFTLALRSFCDCSIIYLMAKFSIQEYVRLISKYQIPVLFLVPPVAVMLTKRPDLLLKHDMSCVMAIFSAAAPLPSDIELQLAKMLPGMVFRRARQGYGLTETTGSVTRSSVEVDDEEPEATVGRVLPLLEMKIVDENTGAALGPGERGELAVRGPLIMKGYYDDDAATEAIIDRQGWLHTGDIGYYDNNENMFVVDRAKELIKYKGLQVAPAELENILLTHPDVDDAAVIGRPDLLAGELPMAFVVRRQNSNVTEKELQKYVSERVAVYQQLTGGIQFTDVIPKLPTGKILRRVLRERLRTAIPSHKL